MPIATEQADIPSEIPGDGLTIPPTGILIEDYPVGDSGGGGGSGDVKFGYGSA